MSAETGAINPAQPGCARRQRKPGEKISRGERIRQLVARVRELEDERKRIPELEKQCEGFTSELKNLRAERQEREEQQKKIPEQVRAALKHGRNLFSDFDSMVAGVQIDHRAFEALLASANGAELFYAAGLGLRALSEIRQLQAREQADRQSVEYYRQLHHEHFGKAI